MRPLIILTLGATANLSVAIQPAQADGFAPHYSTSAQPYRNMVENLSPERLLKLNQYLNYEEREPCQNYRPAPEGFVKKGCFLSLETEPVTTLASEPTPAELRPVIRDYTIHFDFDKSNIPASEASIIDAVSEEIESYEPFEVTIEGYADRSGPEDYNMVLSQKRAQSVSDALVQKGIESRILDKEAYGESNPAVPTDDGVKLQENRRVEIQFRK